MPDWVPKTAGAPTTPLGDRRVVTVLFTDVSGFTAMSERLDPEEVREIVNSFFRVLTEPIYRYGGIVDKYIGDAIMAIFGAPVAHEDDAERAMMAAWSMQNVARAFAAKVQARVGTTLLIRVGLNSGLVVAGTVGGAQKQDYTVIGDTVNLAQRMEASAEPGQILVTQETYKLTSQRFDFSEGVPIRVKGRKEPVTSYVLVGPREAGSSSFRDRLPMVGRNDEMTLMREALGRALDHSPQAVNLIGETGMGKSRLCREFIGEFQLQAVGRVVGGRALSYAEETSDVLVQTLVQDVLGLTPTPTHDEIVSRSASTLNRLLVASDEQEVSLLAHLLGADVPHAGVEAMTPARRRNASFAVVNELLIALAEEAPLVVVLDDLHWTDPSSLEWLRSFLVKIEDKPELPLVVILQFRPSTDKDFSEDMGPPRSNIELGPMPDEDLWELAQVVLGEGRPIDHQSLAESQASTFLEQVIRRSGGNPFFLTELLMSLQENGALVRGTDGWEVHGVAGELTLPNTLSGIVSARLDRLPPEQRRILQVASVIGREFDPDLVETLIGSADLSGTLAELMLDDLLTIQDNGAYAFTHAVVQEVAYQSLLISARRELHGQVGAVLEGKLGLNPDQPQVLARHFTLAEMQDKALHYLFLTGEKAREAHHLPEAAACFGQVLKRLEDFPDAPPIDSTKILYSLGICEMVLGQYAMAQEHLEQAYRQTESPKQAARNLAKLAEVLERQGDLEGAFERLNEALQAVQAEPDPQVHGQILGAIATVTLRMARYDEAVRLCNEGLGHLLEEHRIERATCYSVLGQCYQRLGDFDKAEGAHIGALALREQASDIGGMGKSFNALGNVYADLGQWPKAQDCLLKALNIFRRVGDRAYIGMVLNNLGVLHKERGDLDLAESHFREALKLERSIGDLRHQGQSLLLLAETRLRSGKLEEAKALAQEGLAMYEANAFRDGAVEPFKLLGEILLALDDREGAERALLEAESRAQGTGNTGHLVSTLRTLSRFHLVSGDLPRAEEYGQRALQLLDGRTGRLEVARSQLQQADVMRALGREDEASSLSAEANALLASMGEASRPAAESGTS